MTYVYNILMFKKSIVLDTNMFIIVIVADNPIIIYYILQIVPQTFSCMQLNIVNSAE